MRKLSGVVLITLGTLLTFGGTVQLLADLTVATRVLMWGSVSIVGLFVLGRGVMTLTSDASKKQTVNPEDAVSKTDSRFGRH